MCACSMCLGPLSWSYCLYSIIHWFCFWQDEEDSFVMKAIIHAINDDNVPGLKHLLGSLTSYDINQPNKVRRRNKTRRGDMGMAKNRESDSHAYGLCLTWSLSKWSLANLSSIELISVSVSLYANGVWVYIVVFSNDTSCAASDWETLTGPYLIPFVWGCALYSHSHKGNFE